jgi:Rieske Fe-S protein
MRKVLGRRSFIKRLRNLGIAMVSAAGAWTSWDILRAFPDSGLGGVVKTVPEGEVTAELALYVRTAQTYLTRIDGEVVALWQRCPHLGCRVNWCDSSGEFECACHGSAFNRAGEVRGGPAPRGMDRFAIATTGDGIIEVDTGTVSEGPPPGDETIDEPPRGPSCAER